MFELLYISIIICISVNKIYPYITSLVTGLSSLWISCLIFIFHISWIGWFRVLLNDCLYKRDIYLVFAYLSEEYF